MQVVGVDPGLVPLAGVVSVGRLDRRHASGWVAVTSAAGFRSAGAAPTETAQPTAGMFEIELQRATAAPPRRSRCEADAAADVEAPGRPRSGQPRADTTG
jgi:hypothetical protein